MRDYSTRTMRFEGGWRSDWIRSGILAGFVATFAMTATLTVAWLIANAIGDDDGGQLARWIYNLSENRIVDRVGDAFLVGLALNLIVGIAWALLYARFAEPWFGRSTVVTGMLFAMIPFVISVAVIFPLMNAGFLGSDLGAGPLPFIGNLVLHLVYGGTLGFLYAIESERGVADRANQRRANASAELGAAYGVVIGGIVGAIGGWLVAPTMDELADRPVIMLAGVLAGAAIGTLAGSLIGMQADEEDDRSSPDNLARPPGS
ncbi:MAG: hypothetical protein M3173_07510 [Chloroflexota bacterium]|nr:hypothetical protein [Chloroflexota bacterium]